MCRKGMLATATDMLVLHRFNEIRDIILWIEKHLECTVKEYTTGSIDEDGTTC